jgi:RNA polymerase sigma-70 factor (ECF subfamily)
VEDQEQRLRLERLYVEHAKAVRLYAGRRVDAAAADDAVSEVFVIAWRRLDDVPGDARPWLLGCARNVISHQRRRAGRDAALIHQLQAVSVGRPGW